MQTSNNMFKILFLIGFFLFPNLEAQSQIKKLQGYAHLTWQKGKRILSTEQIVLLTPDSFQSQTIDSFGNTLYELYLTESDISLLSSSQKSQDQIKKLLRLKISSSEFTEILKRTFDQDQIEIIEKKKSKLTKKNYEVIYSHFKKFESFYYPQKIKIQSGKIIITINWQNLSIFL